MKYEKTYELEIALSKFFAIPEKIDIDFALKYI
jgi:hypothetical protein